MNLINYIRRVEKNNMKISIITICFNSEKTIEDTIKSVLNQTYTNYEYLIIDGLSKDNTLNIIKSYEKKFKGKLKYISEKDKGLYDAFNKGIKLASGDIIGIINSDDILNGKDVFKKIIDNIGNNDGIYSDVLLLDENLKNPIRNFISGNPKKNGIFHPAHPTLYLRKKVYEEIGEYNINYKIAADLDLMLRVINNDYKLKYVKDYFVLMRAGGISTNGLKGYYKNFKESYIVLKKNNVKLPLIKNIIRTFKTFNQGLSARINKNRIIESIK